MGFWGSNSDKPSRELPTELQGYQYDYLLKYMESRIGVIRLDDPELQGKLSKLVNDEKTSSLDSYSRHNMPTVYQDSRSGGWSTRPLELEVKHVDNDTYLRGSTKEDIQAVRSGLKSLGFYWDKPIHKLGAEPLPFRHPQLLRRKYFFIIIFPKESCGVQDCSIQVL